MQQSGTNRHEHICESLELFAADVMPEFKAREAVRAKQKQAELAPFIEQALARKPRMAPIDPADVPLVVSFGRRGDAGAQASWPRSPPTAAARFPFPRPIRAWPRPREGPDVVPLGIL